LEPTLQGYVVHVGRAPVEVYCATCAAVNGPVIVPGWQLPVHCDFANDGVANNKTTRTQPFKCIVSSFWLLWEYSLPTAQPLFTRRFLKQSPYHHSTNDLIAMQQLAGCVG
jgi:hypothetical protein